MQGAKNIQEYAKRKSYKTKLLQKDIMLDIFNVY